ncbi:hypothetical protein RND71_008436 [Anisodus tanguticus]|uniref:TCP domain-containing protein n=1 Tax=Anisodus tanguticus TaxID=243964 RepID=A0AAE1SPK2_9SOLA|nr:hypothetical protein RND71_008436 [Anisodus tanguticus]
MDGLTIEWLLKKAMPSIDATISQKASTFVNIKTTRPYSRTFDHHIKVHGKYQRVQVSDACVRKIDLLTEKLGYKMAGLTIEWLLEKAMPSIDATIT